jgi:hypothetical protein
MKDLYFEFGQNPLRYHRDIAPMDLQVHMT